MIGRAGIWTDLRLRSRRRRHRPGRDRLRGNARRDRGRGGHHARPATIRKSRAQAAVDDGDIDALFVLPADLSAASFIGQAEIRCSAMSMPRSVALLPIGHCGGVRAARYDGLDLRSRPRSSRGDHPAPMGVRDGQAAAQAGLPVALEMIEVRSRQVRDDNVLHRRARHLLHLLHGRAVGDEHAGEKTNGTLCAVAGGADPAGRDRRRQDAREHRCSGSSPCSFWCSRRRSSWAPNGATPLRRQPDHRRTVIAAAGLMTFVGSLARSAEQAGNLQSIVALTMAMLGGTFVPITRAKASSTRCVISRRMPGTSAASVTSPAAPMAKCSGRRYPAPYRARFRRRSGCRWSGAVAAMRKVAQHRRRRTQAVRPRPRQSLLRVHPADRHRHPDRRPVRRRASARSSGIYLPDMAGPTPNRS